MIAARRLLCLGLYVGVAGPAWGADLMQLPTMSVVQYGGYVNDIFTTAFKERQVKFDIDLQKGRALYDGKYAIFVLPAKGLSEDRVDKDSEGPHGAAFCHLFLGMTFELLVDGKPIERKRLRIAKGLNHEGEDSEAVCFIGTLRRTKAKDLELCLFGFEKEPLFRAKLESAPAPPGTADFEINVGNANGEQTVRLLVFGKYAASIPFRSITLPTRGEDEATTTVTGGTRRKMSVAGKGGQPTDRAKARHAAGSMAQFDIERTGYSAEGQSLPKRPRVLWRFPAEGSDTVLTPGDPVVDHGLVIFGDDRGQLHALKSADGTEKWTRDCGPFKIVSAPVILDGNVYLASTGDVKCMASSSGKTLWSRELPKSYGESSPLIVGDTLFVACGDGRMRAFNRKSGETIWETNLVADRPADQPGFETQYVLGEGIAMRPRSAASDGTFLFQPIYDQRRVIAVECRSGKRQWAYQTRGWLTSHPVVAGKYVLFGGDDVFLHCVDRQTGTVVWKFPPGAEIDAAPAVANGFVYLAGRNARVHCLELDSGKPVWMHRMDPMIEGSFFWCAPLVTDDAVYIGSSIGFLTALDATTGESKWGVSVANGAEISSFALATDGKRLFAASRAMNRTHLQLGIFAVGD